MLTASCACLVNTPYDRLATAAPAERSESSPAKQRVVLDPTPPPPQRARGTSTIHWRAVPLGEATARMQPLFDERLFVDRRIDPSTRISLDISAISMEQVLTALAAEHGWGVARIGKLLYLGPAADAQRLRSIVSARVRDITRLPAAARTSLARRDTTAWPRLAEPRTLVTSIVEECGWKVVNAEQIPHDLWAAGELSELSVAERLTLLLIGFQLTFELDAQNQAVRIVDLPASVAASPIKSAARTNSEKAAAKTTIGPTKQVYTLRVQEKPVGAVLRELATRLHWALQIDEDAIRAAGKSLDTRVSFSVENADREKLLDALLTPAGLEYTIDGNQLRVLPQRY
ncbi:MAG: STN domain-containing protein [Pirellulales bacterium]